jgi:kinesin family protein 5
LILQQKEASQCEIWASYLQIYCETITDLLWQPGGNDTENGNVYGFNQPLQLREKNGSGSGPSTTVYVEGLSRYAVQSVVDLTELLRRGDHNRSTAATNMNETSSRSHAVLIVKVITSDVVAGTQESEDGAAAAAVTTTGKSEQGYRESTLMLVDLAGSERASASEGRHYARSEEAKAINLSLSALGNCMSALAAPERNAHVPYRDSKLTRLLQGCLGGGARTAVGKIAPFVVLHISCCGH